MRPRNIFRTRRAAFPSLRRIVPFAAILLAFALCGYSGAAGPSSSTGVKVTKTVPFARETIDEIRALAPMRPLAAPGDRAIPFHRFPRRDGAAGNAGSPSMELSLAAPFVGTFPVPSAPALVTNFAGLGNPPHGQDVIPPDTMGAVGPSHVVSLLNSDFGVFNKTTGAVLQQVSLQAFWASLDNATVQPANFPFDTKVVYDPGSSRFFAVTLGGTSSPDSWILIAASASSNPTGTWSKWAIDADLDNNAQQFQNWADFPGFGLDGNYLYVSANMFSNGDAFQYAKVWAIPKAQLLSGASTITWTELRDPPGSDFNMQPAFTFGTAPAEYFLFERDGGSLNMAWIDSSSGTPVWHAPAAVSIAAYTPSGALAGAPQLGDSNTIDTSDTRYLNVVYRNGSLWTTHTVPGASSSRTEVAWYRIDPVARLVRTQGRIADSSRWYYYPSIGVNKDNVAAIGFSGSSTSEYAGGFYTIVDPATGAAQTVGLLKAGEASYFKNLGGTFNRWGDYSATVVDPADDVTFWTVQEYAAAPVAGVSQWGTWWGKFPPAAAPPPPPPPTSSSSGGGGGGCSAAPSSGAGEPFGTPLFSALLLLLPAIVLRVRRRFRRKEVTVPIRHPLC